jgi:hypothetical protein
MNCDHYANKFLEFEIVPRTQDEIYVLIALRWNYVKIIMTFQRSFMRRKVHFSNFCNTWVLYTVAQPLLDELQPTLV